MTTKVLHRADIESLIPGLLYTHLATFKFQGGIHTCTGLIFPTFEKAIEWLKVKQETILYFDQTTIDPDNEELDRVDATQFMVRFADLKE